MSGITTHVLDLSAGRPAAGMTVRLEKLNGSKWTVVAKRTTDGDGRVKDLVGGPDVAKAVYRITFDTLDYFSGRNAATFYPEVTVVFEIGDPAQHYHVPLLVSPWGYSTYRGS